MIYTIREKVNLKRSGLSIDGDGDWLAADEACIFIETDDGNGEGQTILVYVKEIPDMIKALQAIYSERGEDENPSV
jgi:hypothetical protein